MVKIQQETPKFNNKKRETGNGKREIVFRPSVSGFLSPIFGLRPPVSILLSAVSSLPPAPTASEDKPFFSHRKRNSPRIAAGAAVYDPCESGYFIITIFFEAVY